MKCPCILATLLLLLITTPVQSQESFSPDRPGIGYTSFITPVNQFGVEAGFQARHTDFGRKLKFGQLLLRYGVSDNLEIRALLNSYSVLKLDYNPSSTGGIEDFGIGLKYKVQPLSAGAFNSSILAELSIPAGHEIYTSDEFVPSFTYLADYYLNERWSISANVGYRFGIGDLKDSYLLTATPSFLVKNHEDVRVYFGYAGIYDNNSYDQHFLELGGVLNFNSGLQVDINVGFEVDRVATYMGIGFAKGF